MYVAKDQCEFRLLPQNYENKLLRKLLPQNFEINLLRKLPPQNFEIKLLRKLPPQNFEIKLLRKLLPQNFEIKLLRKLLKTTDIIWKPPSQRSLQVEVGFDNPRRPFRSARATEKLDFQNDFAVGGAGGFGLTT